LSLIGAAAVLFLALKSANLVTLADGLCDHGRLTLAVSMRAAGVVVRQHHFR
jgi:hypothetical protein